MARFVLMVIGCFLINISLCVNGMPVEDIETAKKGVDDPENYKEEISPPFAEMNTTSSPIRSRRQIFLLPTLSPPTINPQLWLNSMAKNVTGMMKRDVTSTISPVEIPQKSVSGAKTTTTFPGKVRRAAFPWTPSPTQDVYDNYLGKVRREVLNASNPTTKFPMQKS